MNRMDGYSSSMTAAVTHLLDEALRLPDQSRIELAERILDNTPPPADFIAKQMSIVRKRMANVRAGRSQLVPAEEAHRQIRKALNKKA